MLVTFALMCHDQQPFIRDALRAALAQDYEPLEILISDDHSTDGTFEIIQEEVARYAGPHSIRVIRQSRNIGFENWFHTAEAARGEFVIGAHGDDVSYPQRTRCLVEAWQATSASLLSSNAEIIDAESHLVDFVNDTKSESKWLSAAEIAQRGYHPCMHGATLAWHPDVFRRFAPLTGSRLGAAYDHVLPFRAAILNGSYYVAQPLVRWRVHAKNAGNQSADRTRGPLVKNETRRAYDLGARICMLDDLDHVIKQQSEAAKLNQLHEQLVAKIVELARELTFKRNKLIAAGGRPTWTSREEIEGRADYGKGYGLGKKPNPGSEIRGWLAKKVRNVLAKIARE
jgi:glycosyltransferase involved in cell wall biosynthesis